MPYKDKDRQNQYLRERAARIRAVWFQGKSCIDCGSTRKLENDHKDPRKKISHRVWTWSQKRRATELKKCVVRCQKHHSSRHAIERMRHGVKRYRAGCRCEICLTARAAAKKRNYWNKKSRQLMGASSSG